MNIAATNSGLTSKLNAFAHMAEGTSLYLIRQIDQTVDALSADTKAAEAVTAASKVLSAELNDRTPETENYIDPEDQVLDSLKRSYESIEALLPKMLVMKASIDRDDRLKEHHCDLLHASYEEAISTFASMIESVKDLCASIIRHDLIAEPRDIEEFTEFSDLVTVLRKTA